jgi:hypothetical protein
MDSCSYSKLKSVDIESYDPDMDPDMKSVYPTKQVPPETLNKPRRGRRSCCKTCLCVTLILVGLLVSLSLVVGACAYMWMAGHVKHWTVTQPIHLPVVDVPEAELEVFKDQAKLFFDLLQAGQAPGDFAATAINLNGLAASSDFLRGNAFASMKENQVTVALSLPMDGFPGGKNRFLVGTETLSWDPVTSVLHAKMESPPDSDEIVKTFHDVQFHLSRMDDGKWNLVVLSGQVFGWEIPEDDIKEHRNILEDLYDCDRDDDDCKHARKVIEGIDEISLDIDQVVFHGRADDSSDTAGGYRRVLLSGDEAEISNYGPGWKFQLVRRLAPMF